jgi:transposase
MEDKITISRREYEQMQSQIAAQARELTELKMLVARLMDEIALLKNSHKSTTSSTPPSQDLSRSNSVNLRAKSDKPTGGQSGHRGHTLFMRTDADEIVEHISGYCQRCGQSLETVPGVIDCRRQEVEIPPVQPRYIEHRRIVKQCPCCGLKNKGTFPSQVKAPIQYGSSVRSLIAYMSVYQYLPYQRLKQFFSDVFHLPFSEGTIDNILEDMSRKAEPAYKEIQTRISKSVVVGADETGCRVNGKKHWFHVWQTKCLTFIVAFKSRGHQVIEEYFPNSFSYYVSDCWASQLKTKAKGHQLCLVHLLRELLNFEKALNDSWSIRAKELFYRALKVKKNLSEDDYINPPPAIATLNKELDDLLTVDTTGFHPKVQALVKRLVKHRDCIFLFLTHPDIPADNNASERAIRNVKVKTKVSGLFRNKDGWGADRFARLRSVMDTCTKNGQDGFLALQTLTQC